MGAVRTAWMMCLGLALPVAANVSAETPSRPYAGQETREIKALSADEVDGLLNGEGMGFAKAAELNGFPGPLHVLELADELQLTEEQRLRTQEIFEEMRKHARRLGAMLVEKERELDRLFASQAIAEDELRSLTREIGRIHGELRAAHLCAHLAQKALLTEEQVRRYEALRGYGSAGGGRHDPSMHGHSSRHLR